MLKAKQAIQILESLDKCDVGNEHVKWCKKILGNRYEQWWNRNNHRELIESESLSNRATRVRWKLVQLTKSDLALRPESKVEIPETLAGNTPGRYERSCIVCGERFEASRSDKRTCSTACRMRQSRNRNRTPLHLIGTSDPKHLPPK